MSKKLQVLADPTLVNFFEMKKISFPKKLQVWDQSTNSIPHLYFFLKSKNFSFPKKSQVLDQVHFKKFLQWLDQPTLVFFFCIFEKNYNDKIKCKLSKSQIKWTGLWLYDMADRSINKTENAFSLQSCTKNFISDNPEVALK